MSTTTRKLIPARFRPETDELFSSWISRLAMAHHIKLHTFTSIIFSKRQIWNRDIDKSVEPQQIQEITDQTGYSYQEILRTTLQAYEGKLYEKHNADGNTAWITPVGIYRLTRNRFGLQICPICLAEDREPYYRRRWRLSWVTICTLHQVVLMDRCPGCQNPVIFHRGDMGWRNQAVAYSMVQCSICDLIWTSRRVIEKLEKAPPEDIYLQTFLEGALEDGWCDIATFGMVHSLNFFAGFYSLLRILSVSRRTERFRSHLSFRSGLPTCSNRQERSFDFLPVTDRLRTLRLARWILKDWPNRFIDVAENSSTFSSSLIFNRRSVPYWYWRPINEHLTKKIIAISDQEILSALTYLERQKALILPSDLENLMGRKFFENKPDKFIASIYERMKRHNTNSNRQQSSSERASKRTNQIAIGEAGRNGYDRPLIGYKKAQAIFEFLIRKYRRRERLKMAELMERAQNASKVAKEFGVSPQIVRKWWLRYRQGGINNLDDRSRRPLSYPHQLIFEKEENWIRLLHGEGLDLGEIREELLARYTFRITEGGLYRALGRFGMTLPNSLKTKIGKSKRLHPPKNRNYPHKRIFETQKKWILNLHERGLNNRQIQRALKVQYDFIVCVGTVREVLLKNNLRSPRRKSG